MFLVCYKNKSYLRKGFVLYQEILEYLVTYEKVIHDFAANFLSTSLFNSVHHKCCTWSREECGVHRTGRRRNR
jgi:hypothetical protein